MNWTTRLWKGWTRWSTLFIEKFRKIRWAGPLFFRGIYIFSRPIYYKWKESFRRDMNGLDAATTSPVDGQASSGWFENGIKKSSGPGDIN